MRIVDTLRFILAHPLNRNARAKALWRFASWQFRSRMARRPILTAFAGGTRLLVSTGQAGATGNIYTGLHELPEMAFLLHFLRPSELFVDVGANVGSYTVLAAGAVGARCISFEPDPVTAAAFRANVAVNHLAALVEFREMAVGGRTGEIRFTIGKDTLNHVAPSGAAGSTIQVPVTTLDVALHGEQPRLIKVDVEGFESDVVRGAESVLALPSLGAAILETNGSGARYDASDEDLHDLMTSRGFVPCDYDPFTRQLVERASRVLDGNTIYVRGVEAARSRLRSAPTFDIAGRRSL